MRPRRFGGFSYVGCQRYFLTICTFNRTRVFVSEDVVRDVHEQFLRTSLEHEFALTAYCFMPDHMHLLIEGTSDASDLRVFVATAKQRAAYAARRWISSRLWQQGYYEPGAEG